MSSFTDWATENSITITTVTLLKEVIGYSPWARSDRNEVVQYSKNDGTTLVTETWSPHRQDYMATDALLGRVTAGSGEVEEVPIASVVPDAYSNILSSRLPSIGVLLIADGTGYFVYVGLLPAARTPLHVEFHVTAAGAGAQTAEVGLFSTPLPPNKAGQSLTKLVATGTVDDLTTTGIKRNTTAFATSVPAGTHLWAGIRTSMGAGEPTIASLGRDQLQGQLLEAVAAGALTGAGPFTGTIFALVGATIGQAPELRVVFA